jgi:hypothetical protein
VTAVSKGQASARSAAARGESASVAQELLNDAFLSSNPRASQRAGAHRAVRAIR